MKLYDCFERKERDNGESFVTLKDDAPEWLRDAVYDAHGDMMPNDWVYEACRSICAEIDSERFDAKRDDNDGDRVHEWADGEVDIYTARLWQWAADMRLSSLWAEAEDRANDLLGGSEDTDTRFRVIQYCALERIAHTMIEAWRESQASDDSNEDDNA